MKPNDKAAFYTLVSDAMAYYRQNASEFVLNVWWQGCQPYTLEQVAKALTAHATDADRGQFAPKVADLVRVLSGTHTDRATLAWGKVHESMSSVGAYTDVIFDDPAIHAAIEDMGGWPKMCRTDVSELGHLMHRFCTAHRAYVGRGTFEYPRRLMGDRSPDHEYERYGRKPPRPALVGDPARCKLVFQGGQQAGKTQISYSAVEALGSAVQAPRLAVVS